MLKDNLVLLRTINGLSQEHVAHHIGISRQAYAKWENGATVPDLHKAARLAQFYGVALDALIHAPRLEDGTPVPPAPVDKDLWGTVTISDDGRISLPSEALEKFGLSPGSKLVVGSDQVGIALFPQEFFDNMIRSIVDTAQTPIDK